MSETEPRVCIFSQRGLSGHLSRIGGYEFEDLIAGEFDRADLVVPKGSRGAAYLMPLRSGLSRRSRLYRALGTGLRLPAPPARDYDLFFAYVGQQRDLLTLDAAAPWRRRAARAVCWLQEFPAGDVADSGPRLEILNSFDHVICGLAESVPALARALDVPVHYACWGIDTLAFCPWPDPPARVIDFQNISNLGRGTHAALLAHARAGGGFFYDFPTETGARGARDPREHRWRFADRLKRSRYFYAGLARVQGRNLARGAAAAGPGRGPRVSQVEFGPRYIEGMAAGAVILGERLDSPAFAAHLDWEDSVIPIPFDCPEIVEVLRGLDADPGRIAAARRRNVLQCLARHDSLYRWEQVLDLAGLPHTPAMAARRTRLEARAALVEAAAAPAQRAGDAA